MKKIMQLLLMVSLLCGFSEIYAMQIKTVVDCNARDEQGIKLAQDCVTKLMAMNKNRNKIIKKAGGRTSSISSIKFYKKFRSFEPKL